VRRAKIVATLGPALDDHDRLSSALEAGLDVVRLNFSHGEHAEHARRLRDVQGLADELGRNVGSLADLQGPRIRLGTLPPEGVELPTGGEAYLVGGAEEAPTRTAQGHPMLPVAYDSLASDVEPGTLVLVDDGTMRLVVSRLEAEGAWARIVVGGTAHASKGVNLPGVAVSAPSLTDKDLEDLAFAVELGVDWLALSFVRSPDDIAAARKRVHDLGGDCPVVAKLERSECVDNLPELLEAADAVMVARGDLGVEIGPERVPAIQKEIIARANTAGKPAITATEMLESMSGKPQATRAEASDVANAVFDGTDAVMLSGETAAGSYPVEAVRTMARILEVAESSRSLVHSVRAAPSEQGPAQVVSRSAVEVARDVGAEVLVVYSISGTALQRVSTFRPEMALLGLTPQDRTRRRSALMWGTEALVVPMQEHTVELTRTAEQAVVEGGWVDEGDLIVIVSGPPKGQGGTNRLMVHRIGDVMAA
jgi:pyruvate kinase